MSVIELQKVNFKYQASQEIALREINLQIDSGDFVAVIGANGSGKSTLARLLNVLLVPTDGDVYIDGLNTKKEENIWEIRKKVGMIFQNPDNQLVATMVEEDVAFGLENLAVRSSKIRDKVDRALKMVEMDGYQCHPPHQLSGGQKQRIAIAGVIAMEPSCIVFDEPTAMLDPQGRAKVMEIVNNLNQEKNITVIYITHFMEEAIKADKVLVMNKGKIVKNSVPADIFKDSKFLSEINLDVPVFIELADKLRQNNIPLPEILSVEELVNALC